MSENVQLQSPTTPSVPASYDATLLQAAKDRPTLRQQLFENRELLPVYFGLAGLPILYGFLRGGLRASTQAALAIKRHLTVNVEIISKDPTFPVFLHWMTANHRAQISRSLGRNATSDGAGARVYKLGIMEKLLRRFPPRMHDLTMGTQKSEEANDSEGTHTALTLGPGKYLLRYKDALLMVSRTREKSFDLQMGKPFETINITALYSQLHVFEEIMMEANRLVQQATEGKTVVYRSRGIAWESFGEPKSKRPIDSVILEKGVKEMLVSDFNRFLGRRERYRKLGLPYRRGYLLYGPPGSGKSSFIQSLAGEHDHSMALLNIGERGLTDDRLDFLIATLPPKTFLVLEDIDMACPDPERGTSTSDYQSHVTLSGLLNALDGAKSLGQERVVFMTANHPDRLGAALSRPGRIDMEVRVGEATRSQVEQLWDCFYDELDEGGHWRSRFLQRLEELGIIESEDGHVRIPRTPTSMAALQGLFLAHMDDPEGAITKAGDLISRIAGERFASTVNA